jgi:ketosteroid isomerase-like protein
MSAESVEVMRRALGRFIETGEPDWGRFDEAIAVRDHDILDAAAYDGREGFRRWLADWSGAWSDFDIGPVLDVIDAGDEVVVVFRMRATGRASGVEVEREDAMVCRVRHGRIERIDYYNNRGQALEQVGLEP